MRPLRTSWLVSIAIAAVSFGAGYLVFVPKGKPRADGAAPAGTMRGMLAGRFSAASEDRVAALFAAFDEREPLRRDAAIFHAIEQLQPGDALGALGDLVELMRRVERLPRDLWPHLAEAVLDRWLDLDAPGALRWVEATHKLAALDPKKFGSLDAATLAKSIEVFARREPDWAIRQALTLPVEAAPGQPFGPARGTTLQGIFAELAARDPAAARRRLAELPEADRKDAHEGLMWGLAKTDPAAAFTLARTEPGPADLRMFSGLVVTAAPMAPQATREAIAHLPDAGDRARMAATALTAIAHRDGPLPFDWMSAALEEAPTAVPYWLENLMYPRITKEPEALRAWVDGLGGAARDRAESAYFQALSRDRVAPALDWLSTQPPDFLPGSPEDTRRQFEQISFRAPEELSGWLARQAPGPLRDSAALGSAPALATSGRIAEAGASYQRVMALDPAGATAARLAFNAMQKDTAATLAWVQTMPPGVQQQHAARAIGESWTWRDPAAAAEWVESLPAGPLRDSAIAGYAPVAMHADPAAAAASVERIAAPATKQAAAEKVFQVWLGENPIAARRWLRCLAGVESAWVEKTLHATP